MKVALNIYKDENGVLIAESPFLQWFHTYWKNEKELSENLKELAYLYKEMLENEEIDIPKMNYIKLDFIDIKTNNVLCEK